MDVHIVYSKVTGRVRWYAVPENEHEVIELNPHPGEGVLKVPKTTHYGNHEVLQEHVNKHTGKVPANDRYAIVHPSGEVTGAVIACPACGDTVDGHQLIAHPDATQGWRFDHSLKSWHPPVTVDHVG